MDYISLLLNLYDITSTAADRFNFYMFAICHICHHIVLIWHIHFLVIDETEDKEN